MTAAPVSSCCTGQDTLQLKFSELQPAAEVQYSILYANSKNDEQQQQQLQWKCDRGKISENIVMMGKCCFVPYCSEHVLQNYNVV